ncbi:MAG: hypothetical protein H0T79_15485 [Deltaproteobacteria bacterium]|nr:hypothetical protein [Deltaproteobacteria bacterium]
MRSLVVVMVFSCGEPERAPSSTPPVPATRLVMADQLLVKARAYAQPTMGLESLTLVDVRSDGTMGPTGSLVKVEWQQRRHAGDVDTLSKTVPCVKLTWTPGDQWVRDPATSCTALGRPGLGYARLGLPRCSVAAVLKRLRDAGTPVPAEMQLTYATGMPYTSEAGPVVAGKGMWKLGTGWTTEDDCGVR